MAKSGTLNLDRVLDDGLAEEEYVAVSSTLIQKVYDKSLEWKDLVRQEEDPSDVKKKAEEVAIAANTLEKVQRNYRAPTPVEHGSDRRENFDGADSELLLQSNKAVSYAQDLGTKEFYDFQDPQEIDEGAFCVLDESEYVTPGKVLEEMPHSYTEDMLRVDFSEEPKDLPEFEDYTTLPEL